MNIAIDARWIFPRISGIGAYTQELIRQLAQIDRENRYILLFDNPTVMKNVSYHARLDLADNFSTEVLPYGVFSPKGQLFLPGRLRRLGVDVYHSPNYMIPFLAFPRNRAGRLRCVVNIHDLIPLLFPGYTPKARKTKLFPLYRRLMIEVGARADIMVTGSESSRGDILRELNIPAGRHEHVVSIPDGVAPEFSPAPRTSAHQKTILYVGRFDPYKNIVGLVDVFARVRALTQEDIRLRVVGSPDERYPEAPARARERGVARWIDWEGYVPDEQLVNAYRDADAFVLISRYEGFGLTVLEAMACGTPVVCSNRSSLPEVAGTAALLVDPDDTEAVARAIVRVLSEPALAAQLREQGLRQAAEFTWTRTAAKTLKVYEQAHALAEGAS